MIPLLAILGIALAAIAGAELLSPNPTSTQTEVLDGVDPNTARWWELVDLPGIGPVLADEITRYRVSVLTRSDRPLAVPVFRTAADLAKVRGIGPKTVRRIAPHLRFDDHGPETTRVHDSED